ncbi:hypothetical protein [Glycomyces dulcitolivorans]|uniref:hypothetical protein n=1 Tax=Glycomyces dulcitolivorans TaxID=2200759 RepID=UPI000DD3BFE8|nr:hypothetical protein [Glycomyces dulcitolivorans]
MSEIILKASDLRNSEYCFDLAETHGMVAVTKFGKPIGFLVGAEEGERIREERGRLGDEKSRNGDRHEAECREEVRLLKAEVQRLQAQPESECRRCEWAWSEMADLRGQNQRLRLDYQLLGHRTGEDGRLIAEGELPFYVASSHAVVLREIG